MTRREALEILGLDGDASLDKARTAYRELAKVYHPDKNTASNAAVMFRIISEAWELVQKDSVQAHVEAEAAEKKAEEEATRRRTAEESARQRSEAEAQRRRAEEEAARRRAEEARRRAETETARTEELNRRKEKETEDKIWFRSYAVCFIICFIYFCVGIIGNWLGIDGFVGSESLNVGDLSLLLLGTFVMAAILGSITGGVIIRIRKWLK